MNFTDIEGPVLFQRSKQAMQAMRELAEEYHLSFDLNPGGGAYENPQLGRCQISTYDDVMDYEKLRDWLETKNVQPSFFARMKNWWLN